MALETKQALARAVIFLGPPGAGKGTQARLVAGEFHVPHLSTGEMLRENAASGTELGRLARPIMESGGLVPDDLILRMVEDRIARADCANGFVFDGFPRTLPQAEALNRILERQDFGPPVVIFFRVADDILMRRMTGRRTCKVGSEIYNIYDFPPKVAGRCDVDGGELIQRPDDRPEVIRERLAAYGRQTKPLVAYYRSQGMLDEIDAAAGRAAVTDSVFAVLHRPARRP
ncbi:MAG: adenylate kinase [Candidatus Acidiferrales bacterium]